MTLTGIFAAFVFFIFVFLEVKEEIGEFVDYELEGVATQIFAETETLSAAGNQFDATKIRLPLQHYWIRLLDGQENVIYQTEVASKVDIDLRRGNEGYLQRVKIPLEFLYIPPSEQKILKGWGDGMSILRARMFFRNSGDASYTLCIARPMNLINVEITELVRELLLAIIVTLLTTSVIAYVVSGRMLRPLGHINRLIREIRETSLNKRIPLRKSRDELYTLSTSLNSMFDRLQFSFEKQKEFITNASHEMKSPLTILMIGHEEMLIGDLPKQVRRELERQLGSMQRMNKLIRDLLSIARLEQRDNLLREPVLLDKIIRSVLGDYNDLIGKQGIRLSVNLSPLSLRGDREKLHRLFINLIDNAIKYNCEHDGFIQINTRKQGQQAVVEIENSGKTIPQVDLSHIFDQFYRVEKSRSQAYGGSGLGLTIVRRIVEMHGGSISVESENGVTIFTIVFPVDTPSRILLKEVS
jgi:signal transduction histidine kinase